MSDVMLDGQIAEECDKEKRMYLFYYCEGVDAWVPATRLTENTVDPGNYDDGEEWTVRFKRFDMTLTEFNNLPED